MNRKRILATITLLAVAMFLVLAPIVPIKVQGYFYPHPCPSIIGCNVTRQVTIYGSATYTLFGIGLAYIPYNGIGFYWAPPIWQYCASCYLHLHPPNVISVRDVHLCVGAVICPSPYLSGTILVNGSAPLVPLSTLRLFINGTDEGLLFPTVVTTTETSGGTTTVATTLSYAIVVTAQPNNPAMPIIAGKTYTILVVATFQDNSTSTASVTVVAGGG